MFAAWNKTELDSYLIEITAEIVRYHDDDGVARVSKIRDSAGASIVYTTFDVD